MKLKNKDLSKVSPKFLKKITTIAGLILLVLFLFVCFEIYIPLNFKSNETVIYAVQKGQGSNEIADSLQKLGIIKSSYFFKFYATVSLQRSILQAGRYNLSPRMSIYKIVKEMAQGNAIQDKAVILEGWTTADIGKYLQTKGMCTQKDFVSLAQKDYSGQFDFLADKPKDVGLEGYLFPDTYQIAKGETCEDFLNAMLENFGNKLTPNLRAEIKKQNKSIFDIVTMASLLEKEVRTLNDKEIVSGILWKRISIGMPLQLDSTINYITDGSDPSVSIKATQIDSPYNTYMYKGLPKGPISNPGIDSINAAIQPKATNYLYYLSDGKTVFSETLEQHDEARAKYLN